MKLEPNVPQQDLKPIPYGVSGLGGWLVLVQIGLYATMILLLITIFGTSVPALTTESWEILTSVDSELYHPLWGPLIIFEVVYNIGLFFFCFYLLVALYRKQSIFPKLMIIFYSVSLVVGVADYVFANMIPMVADMTDTSMLRDMIRSMLTCAIWIPYFLKSERVKNTFIR